MVWELSPLAPGGRGVGGEGASEPPSPPTPLPPGARGDSSQTIHRRTWSAIQITTAAALCAAVDLHVAGRLPATGFVKQEEIDFDQFIHNRFGRYYASPSSTRFSQVVTETPAANTP